MEVACGGDIRRTGTAFSVLAVLSGIDADDAVAWVRKNYHSRAVEARHQQRWISKVAVSLTA